MPIRETDGTAYVPPDGGHVTVSATHADTIAALRSVLDEPPVVFAQDYAARDAAPAVPVEDDSAPATEDTAAPLPVWAMRTPSVTGNARMTTLDRPYMWQWQERYRVAEHYGARWDEFTTVTAQRIPRFSRGYRRPDTIVGSGFIDGILFNWTFLGWHDNHLPMLAVQSADGSPMSEATARRAIRARIANMASTAMCDACTLRYPATDEWPIPSGYVAWVTVPGWGRTTRCGTCAATYVRCEFVYRDGSRCTQVGGASDLHRLVPTVGASIERRCGEHTDGTIIQCRHCRVWYGSTHVLRSHDCLSDNPNARDWRQCRRCTGWTRLYQSVEFHDGTTADLCNPPHVDQCYAYARQCTACNRYALSFIRVAGANPGRVCDTCMTRLEIEECDHCARNFPASEEHDCSASCHCDRCRYGNVIRSYSYKPSPRFKGSDDSGLYLGMELEVFAPRDGAMTLNEYAQLAQDGLGRVAYLKQDGSIGHGFEMVTHPMTYAWAMEQFSWETLSRLADEGCFATDGAGIHVHASRKGFSGPAHEYRWMIFMHRNNAQVSVIARRVSDQWASWSDEQRKYAKQIATKKRSDNTRYRAINQTNAQTIEIRVFKSSLNVTEAKAALALVHASITYTREIRSQDILKGEAWGWGAFAQWVSKRSEYAPLWSEMQARNVTTDTLSAPMPEPEPSCDYNCDGGRGDDDCQGNCDCDPCMDGCRCPENCAGCDDCRGTCTCRRCADCVNRCGYTCNGDNTCNGDCDCDDCDECTCQCGECDDCDPEPDGTPEPDSDLDQTDYDNL